MPKVFSNDEVAPASLTAYQTQKYSYLEPTHITTNIILRLVLLVVILVLLMVVRWLSWSPLADIEPVVFTWILLASVAVAIGIMFIRHRYDKSQCYALRECDISVSSGVIFTKIIIQPFVRIQHVEIKRGPIARYLGLARLEVFSAGGALHTFKLPGVTHATALKLREYMLTHQDVTTDG